MAKSRKPESPAKADAQTKGQDTSETAETEDTTGADSISAASDTPVTDATNSETSLSDADIKTDAGPNTAADDKDLTEDKPDVSEAEALSVADPEPVLDTASEPGSATDDDGTKDAGKTDEPLDGESGMAASGADPEGTGDAPDSPDIDAPSAVTVVQEKVIEHKAGFVPTLLGGVLAAAIGFGLSQYLGGDLFGDNDAFANETRAALTEQTDSLDALNGRIDGLQESMPVIDLTSVETAIAGLSARSEELGTALGDLTGRMTALEEGGAALGNRVTELEKAPVEDAVSPAAIAAYEQEIARLREEVQATLADVEVQRQEISAIAEEAVAAERNANLRASRAELRGALAELTTEVDAGRPFADALAPLEASDMVDVPEVLSANATEGVATQAELIDTYPDAARAALGAARSATADEGGGNRLGSFFAEQLGARSVTPRDGTSADAILSRAEAAVKGGDLDTAINEISTLPEASRTALQEWVTRAETRAAAIAATDALSAELDTE
ncbi:COG4223 family protein [Roseivivax sp. CAU 1753]